MNVLVIAPHPDDEILGVGGTMAKHIANGDDVYVCVVTRPVAPLFDDELFYTIRRETNSAHSYLKVKKTFFLELPTVQLETVPRYELNGKIKAVVDEVVPNVVYIPHIGDMQKDHQIVTEASMVALRPKYKNPVKCIYAYETLSETGWNIPNVQNEFIPNVYVDISKFLNDKLSAMKEYKSQVADFPAARSIQAIEALSRFRGATVNVNAAEAFVLIREIK